MTTNMDVDYVRKYNVTFYFKLMFITIYYNNTTEYICMGESSCQCHRKVRGIKDNYFRFRNQT